MRKAERVQILDGKTQKGKARTERQRAGDKARRAAQATGRRGGGGGRGGQQRLHHNK